jgi:Uma2 family endonuclease
MTVMGVSASRPLTVADLEGMPDDGRRYELLDGVLLVTPAPGWPHQEMALSLAILLRQNCPRELHVLIAPFAIRPNEYTELQPDLLVARYADLTLNDLPVAPVLAVEVLSRSTRLVDLNLKRAAFARLGVPSYWLLDPEPRQPSVTVLELDHGSDYRETATATGEEELAVDRPFPVRFRPADLLSGLWR